MIVCAKSSKFGQRGQKIAPKMLILHRKTFLYGMDISYFSAAPWIWLVAVIEYISLNKRFGLLGLIRTMCLYALTSCVALLPMALAGHSPEPSQMWFAAGAAFLFQLPWPVLFRITRGRRERSFRHYADAAVSMLFFGVLCTLLLLGGPFAWLVGPLELLLLTTVVIQVTFFALYGTCMDANGYRLMTQTNTNEVIEFIKYYPWWMSTGLIVIIVLITGASIWLDLPAAAMPPAGPAFLVGGAGLLCVLVMCVGGRRSLLSRSGFVSFMIEKAETSEILGRYPEHRDIRRSSINVEPAGEPYDGPSTIMLVIGESANRDYMSAFRDDMDHDTTPWLNAMRRNDTRHMLIYPNAYSCGMHTFMALEEALTEKNQHHGINFSHATNILDIARAAGRRVHWYSNQGHLGASLSQVSVIADEADEARWTEQHPGMPPLDSELLQMLDGVDPQADNLVVVHLKGNHFSFENRYPAEFARWQGAPGSDHITATYHNSMLYVDDILRRLFESAKSRLNLKAMVYCSDHAIIPDAHRAPVFSGFGDVRIPLAVWTSDDFIARHPERYEALQANRGKYWTNDFLFDLMCGLMDVDTPRSLHENSLAHNEYRHRRETLTVLRGTVRLSDDRTA